MQNLLKAGSSAGTKAGLSHDMQFFSYARAMERRVTHFSKIEDKKVKVKN